MLPVLVGISGSTRTMFKISLPPVPDKGIVLLSNSRRRQVSLPCRYSGRGRLTGGERPFSDAAQGISLNPLRPFRDAWPWTGPAAGPHGKHGCPQGARCHRKQSRILPRQSSGLHPVKPEALPVPVPDHHEVRDLTMLPQYTCFYFDTARSPDLLASSSESIPQSP